MILKIPSQCRFRKSIKLKLISRPGLLQISLIMNSPPDNQFLAVHLRPRLRSRKRKSNDFLDDNNRDKSKLCKRMRASESGEDYIALVLVMLIILFKLTQRKSNSKLSEKNTKQWTPLRSKKQNTQ